MRMPTAGEQFKGKYTIERVLGEGGFATVFLAHDVEVKRDVAIKVLRTNEYGEYEPGLRARFLAEGRVLAQLRDPHTIRLFDFGETTDGALFMVSQYVAGEDLDGLLTRVGRLDVDTALHIAIQVLQALAEAHKHGVLHRDVKPSNILVHEHLDDPFSVKLLDFGIAKITVPEGHAGLTRTGMIVGTPRYMAPEQQFGETLAPTVDIYAMGLVLYEMIVGVPAVGGTQREVLQRQASAEPFALPAGFGSDDLRLAIARMTDPEPFARYPSAAAAADALTSLRDPEKVREQPRRSEPARRPPRVATQPEAAAGAQPVSMSWKWVMFGAAVVVGSVLAATLLTTESAPPPVTVAELPTQLLISTTAPVAPDVGRPSAASDVGPPPDVAQVEEVADGCGIEYPQEWSKRVTLGGGREMRVWLPIDYDPERRYPVVLVFQSNNLSTGQTLGRVGLSRFFDRPEDNEFIALALESESMYGVWTGTRDMWAVEQIIPTARRHFCIDESRVYAVGHGRGAQMAHEASCRIALSGLSLSSWAEFSDLDGCVPVRPIPTHWTWMSSDPFVPIGGGHGCRNGPYNSREQQDAIVRERNGCSKRATTVKAGGASCKRFSCDVAYMSCEAPGGHYIKTDTWSVMQRGCPSTITNVDLAASSWPFFQSHGIDRRATPE